MNNWILKFFKNTIYSSIKNKTGINLAIYVQELHVGNYQTSIREMKKGLNK